MALVGRSDTFSMRVDVTNAPAYALAYVKMAAGEAVLAEPGSLVSASAGISVSASVQGGVVRAALRKTFAQESFFQSRYTAVSHGAWVALAPRFPGDIYVTDVVSPLVVQSGSVLGYAASLQVSAAAGSLSTLLLREGVATASVTGTGTLLLASYGGIDSFELAAGEEMIVDTGHLVAWSQSCDLAVGPLAGPTATAISGEWLVGKVTGPGLVVVQTRSEQQFRSWLLPERGHDSRRR